MDAAVAAGRRMKILITGICGFVGTAIAESLLERREGLSICGIDNLNRPGSEINRVRLRKRGVKFIHGDIRQASDFEVAAGRRLGDRRRRQSQRPGRARGQRQQPAAVRAQSREHRERAGVLQDAPRRPAAALEQPRLLHSGAHIAAAETKLGSVPSRRHGRPSRRRLRRAASASTSPLTRRSRCTAAPSWPPRRWRWNTATRSTSRCGSTAAACWPGPGSSARPSRAFSPIG